MAGPTWLASGPIAVAALLVGQAGPGQTLVDKPPQAVQLVTVAPGTRILLEAPPAETAPTGKRPLRTFWNRLGLGCWGHHDEPTTGNFYSECLFIFGSSRDFFGEPCQSLHSRLPEYYKENSRP